MYFTYLSPHHVTMYAASNLALGLQYIINEGQR